MKILISLYIEDIDTGKARCFFSQWLSTDLQVNEIFEYLGLTQGFYSTVTIGQNLSFADIYFYSSNLSDSTEKDRLINAIKLLPISKFEDTNIRYPLLIKIVSEHPDGIEYQKHLPNQKQFLRIISQFEYGASGYSDLIIWMSNSPIEMIFIGGFVYDLLKMLLSKVFGFVKENQPIAKKENIIFSVSRFYKEFSKMTHIPKENCQIVEFCQLKSGYYSLVVRTIANEKYKVQSIFSGKIRSMERVDRKHDK